MTNQELAHCPHCGSTGERIHIQVMNDQFGDRYGVVVLCDFELGGCGASSGLRKTEDSAREAWNRRAADEPTRIERERDEALRALQNCLLVVPEGPFKREMEEWLNQRLGLSAEPTEPLKGGVPLAAVIAELEKDPEMKRRFDETRTRLWRERTPCPFCGRLDNHEHVSGPWGMT